MSKHMKLCLSLSSILLNHFITDGVFFHWLIFVAATTFLLILSRICLLILPISDLIGSISLQVEPLCKFQGYLKWRLLYIHLVLNSWWVRQLMKQRCQDAISILVLIFQPNHLFLLYLTISSTLCRQVDFLSIYIYIYRFIYIYIYIVFFFLYKNMVRPWDRKKAMPCSYADLAMGIIDEKAKLEGSLKPMLWWRYMYIEMIFSTSGPKVSLNCLNSLITLIPCTPPSNLNWFIQIVFSMFWIFHYTLRMG